MGTSSSHQATDTPVYCIDAFLEQAAAKDFYIRNFQSHLRDHEFVSRPHKHDFYLLLYVTRGSGSHTIDFTVYDVAPGTVFLMTPGQVHSWQLEPGTDGFIVFFTRQFYQMDLSRNSLIDFPFYDALDASPVIEVGGDTAVEFIFHKMETVFAMPQRNERMLRAWLDVLLLELAENFNAFDKASANSETARLRKLEQLIERNFVKLKRPSDYADLMNLTSSYLNNLCRKNLNKTLSQLVQERVLLEAKRLLAYSDLSAKQVAGRLGFADVSYFNKYFKKYTGSTPDEFRESMKTTI